VRATERLVQVYHHGDLAKTHVRAGHGRVPTSRTTRRRRSRPTGAHPSGTASRRDDRPVHPSSRQRPAGKPRAQYQLRSGQAILALADKHDPIRLEAACSRAMLAGDPAYRTIRNILAAGLEAAELPKRPGGDGGDGAWRSCMGPTSCSATSSPSRAPTRSPMTRPSRDRHAGIRTLGSTRPRRATTTATTGTSATW
jgi:hypothetical protein